ncbi:hypothetical protein [Streptomyces sp. NPDC047108]|uniref:hypothetical protein n=1 Tax=Streptomyces sp. NPDC047108 TaxID=3155025 RepID=UPI0033C217DC
MPRRPLPTAAALTTAAALLLTACGGGEDTTGGGKAAEADQATRSAAPGATAEKGPDRPRIELPSDLTYEFDWARTGDRDKDAVLRDGEQFIKATDLAIAEQDPTHQAYRFYAEGEAAAGTQTYVQRFVDHKARTTGTYRFSKARVSVKGGTASLVYCENQGKAYNKDIETGKVDVTPVSENSYVVYSTRLRKNDRGVWVTEKVVSRRGAAQCRP